VLAALERLEPLGHAADPHQLVIALAEAAVFQHRDQHEGEACRRGVDRKRAAPEVGIGPDFRHGHQRRHDAGVRRHHRDRVGHQDRHLALAFVIGDHMVHQGDGEIRIAHSQPRPLEHRPRRGRDIDRNSAGSKKSSLLRHPDRPVESARKHDHVHGLCRPGNTGPWRDLRHRCTPPSRKREFFAGSPSAAFSGLSVKNLESKSRGCQRFGPAVQGGEAAARIIRLFNRDLGVNEQTNCSR
jgi:hypothetical protein